MKKTSQETFVSQYGDEYIGDIQDDLPNGQGTLTYSDGDNGIARSPGSGQSLRSSGKLPLQNSDRKGEIFRFHST
jgi:hypothetical protein